MHHTPARNSDGNHKAEADEAISQPGASQIESELDPVRALAIEIVEIFVDPLREEEIRDAFHEVYDRLQSGLDRFTRRSADRFSSESETTVKN